MTRDELEEQIDRAVPRQLAQELGGRIQAAEGLILGAHILGESQNPVKLTRPFRNATSISSQKGSEKPICFAP